MSNPLNILLIVSWTAIIRLFEFYGIAISRQCLEVSILYRGQFHYFIFYIGEESENTFSMPKRESWLGDRDGSLTVREQNLQKNAPNYGASYGRLEMSNLEGLCYWNWFCLSRALQCPLEFYIVISSILYSISSWLFWLCYAISRVLILIPSQ